MTFNDEYISRKEAILAVTNDGCTANVVGVLYHLPSADVAPRSEVVKVLNEVELLIIITKEAYKQQMEDAPNELSKQSKRTKWVAFEKFYEQFSEFKKEYTDPVHCKDCQHLMFSDCYGECSKGHKGIVKPDDYCEYGVKKNDTQN